MVKSVQTDEVQVIVFASGTLRVPEFAAIQRIWIGSRFLAPSKEHCQIGRENLDRSSLPLASPLGDK